MLGSNGIQCYSKLQNEIQNTSFKKSMKSVFTKIHLLFCKWIFEGSVFVNHYTLYYTETSILKINYMGMLEVKWNSSKSLRINYNNYYYYYYYYLESKHVHEIS
jgi:hypothetical protein